MGVGLNLIQPFQKAVYIPPKFRIIEHSGINASAVLSKKLDLSSEAAKFFGIDSMQNVQSSENQLLLSILKLADCDIYNMFNRGLRVYFNDALSVKNAKQYFGDNGGFNKLLEKGAGRWTFKDEDAIGIDGGHTIGIVYDKVRNRLFVLDSLSEKIPNLSREEIYLMRKWKNIIMQILNPYFYNMDVYKREGSYYPKIIFSDKYQQNLTEFTCNNWTHANIDAVINALKNGMDIKNTEELNNILPDNINKVLQEQMEYVKTNRHRFYEIIAMRYNIGR